MSKDNDFNIKDFPNEISILPLRNTVVYPLSIVPLLVGIKRSVKLVTDALEGDHIIGLVTVKDGSVEEPQPNQIYEVGTLVKVDRVRRDTDNNLHIMVQGLERFRIDHWVQNEPYLRAKIEYLPDLMEKDLELDALHRSLLELTQEVVELSPQLPKEIGGFLSQIQDPRQLVYLVATYSNLEVSKAQEILEMNDLKDKLRALVSHLTHEKEVLDLGKKIQTEAREEMDKAQRDYYLRQQLRAIQKELGEKEEGESVSDEYTEKLEKAKLPEEAEKEAKRELKRLGEMSPHSPEYSVIRTYLDWLLELPWDESSEDQNDIQYARQVLDEDHYDLQEVKERIIEYLSVRKLIKERGVEPATEEEKAINGAGVILCFAGPPGVGKTSLGHSIARALGRKFTRMSLGGMRDEAEIRGHRRTYIGAMPGRIIQAIKRAGTRNPVFMLDEVDKVGSDWRGDPSSALLEVLDPAQNHAFRDHYLDLDFDLSEVIFITTANNLETIPAPLRDRMEIIQLDGYTEFEKVRIAQQYLVPRQIKANGLLESEIAFTEEALKKLIQDYTKEAGVRDLERQIGAVCRKSAVKIVGSEPTAIEITPQRVRDFLKKERFESDISEAFEIPGISTGLAVTAFGGDILFIEATGMKGKGQLTLTGQLGDVMRESAQIAHSFVRSKASQLCIDAALFETTDIHIHVPAGAIPKDGPSAGVAMIMAIASLFSGRPVHSDVGMTGEVTLRGRVLPVGGIKTKVLAAHRAGLKKVILPKRNERDLEDIPEEVRNDLEFILVERIDEALEVGLLHCVEHVDMDIAANS
ncbi:MAG: endopeptidase La [Deltaproteobacteria bacterium]|nr:endopeptidase La [Deltaproteobacteria bacterium]